MENGTYSILWYELAVLHAKDSLLQYFSRILQMKNKQNHKEDLYLSNPVREVEVDSSR